MYKLLFRTDHLLSDVSVDYWVDQYSINPAIINATNKTINQCVLKSVKKSGLIFIK